MPPRGARHAMAQMARGFAARLLRGLRAARKLHQHAQRFDHRPLAHDGPPDRTEAALLVNDPSVACGDREMHQANGLSRRGAAGAGDASDRNRQIDTGALQRADRHLRRRLLAHSAECQKRLRIDAEHRALGVVGIGDKAAVDHVGRARDIRQCAGDEPAGAGFRRGNRQPAAAAQIEQRAGQGPGGADLTFASHLPHTRMRASNRQLRQHSIFGEWSFDFDIRNNGSANSVRMSKSDQSQHCWTPSHSLQGRGMLALAVPAMPSSRPVKPSFSLVVAFTATREMLTPDIPAMRARIWSRSGPIFGRSQIRVTSRLAIRPPRAVTRSTAYFRNWSEEAPFHFMSLGGKCEPMSPSASAPRMASTSACRPTSPSEWARKPFVCGTCMPQIMTWSPAPKACTS